MEDSKTHRVVISLSLYTNSVDNGLHLAMRLVRDIQNDPDYQDSDLGITLNVHPVEGEK